MYLTKRNLNLSPWSASHRYSTVERTFDDLWTDMFGDFFTREKLTSDLVHSEVKDEKFVLYLNAPGHKKEDFQVSFENGVISVSAEQNKDIPLSTAVSVSKTIPEVDETKLEAQYEGGILTISAPLLKKGTNKKTIEVR